MRLGAALFAICVAGGAFAEGIVTARYDEETARYDHGILGDAIEWAALVMETDRGRSVRLRLPENRVFEDTAPRVVDLDGDGDGEVVTVETDLAKGARLAIWDAGGLVAATDFIGRTHRWLAPVGHGAADLDGDGRMELAYVDRPHLAKTLRVWRFVDGRLVHLADLPGVTNHRIGERDIAGGFRDCDGRPQAVVASADWTRVLAVSFDGDDFELDDLGPHSGRDSFARALACREVR